MSLDLSPDSSTASDIAAARQADQYLKLKIPVEILDTDFRNPDLDRSVDRFFEYEPDTNVVRSDGGRRLSATGTTARLFTGTATLVILGTFAGLVYMFASDSMAFAVGTHPLLGPVTALPVVAGLLLIRAAVTGFSARSAPDRSRLEKAHFALVVAVGELLAELVAYNLVVA
jgi:hypothetical protein